jgi:hypothetical protein
LEITAVKYVQGASISHLFQPNDKEKNLKKNIIFLKPTAGIILYVVAEHFNLGPELVNCSRK